MKKTVLLFALLLSLILTMSCFGEDATVTYSNDGLKMTIPAEYADLLVVDMSGNDPAHMIFSVSERASIESVKARGESGDGAGWLFGVGRVSEEEYHEMICHDMNGLYVFAKDADGAYYMYYHPTDVRLFRDDNEQMQASFELWGELNTWARSMKATIIEENGLIPESHGNQMLDMYLAQMLYHGDDLNYTVSTLEYGPMEGKGTNNTELLEKLVYGVSYTMVNDAEVPDGEYVVLKFPDDGVRFDFFLLDGSENLIRQTWADGYFTTFYKAEFDDESLTASGLMLDLYHDLVLADSLGYTPDDLVGIWAEKIAGRGSIEISKSETPGQYDVRIHWGSSAFETYFWSMTAVSTGYGAELSYEDCTLTDIVFTSEDQSTETVLYENGTGTFDLLSTYELVWNDETGHAADDTVFINAG